MDTNSVYHGEGVKLDLGSGEKWAYFEKKGFKGIDILPLGQEHVLDLRQSPLPYKDNEVDAIRASHFLEHLEMDHVINLLNECWRVLKKNKFMHVVVPSALYEKTYVLSHRTFMTEATFRYLAHEKSYEYYGWRRWHCQSVLTDKRGDVHAYIRPAK